MHSHGTRRWKEGNRLIGGILTFAACLALSLSLLLLPPRGLLRAENPNVTSRFANVAPPSTTVPPNASGIVVEGVDDNCQAATLQQIEEATVSWLKADWEVWTELTIDTYCGKTIAQYESDVASIIGYVEPIYQDCECTPRWLGFMLDEETGYGFQLNDLNGLNQYVISAVNGYTYRPTWWAAEVFSGQGNWSQSDYNGLIYSSYPAPEIATNYMRDLENSYYDSFQTRPLVTWSTGYPSPYNNEASSVDAIQGVPFGISVGKTTYYYDNQFCPGSCM